MLNHLASRATLQGFNTCTNIWHSPHKRAGISLTFSEGTSLHCVAACLQHCSKQTSPQTPSRAFPQISAPSRNRQQDMWLCFSSSCSPLNCCCWSTSSTSCLAAFERVLLVKSWLTTVTSLSTSVALNLCLGQGEVLKSSFSHTSSTGVLWCQPLALLEHLELLIHSEQQKKVQTTQYSR